MEYNHNTNWFEIFFAFFFLLFFLSFSEVILKLCVITFLVVHDFGNDDDDSNYYPLVTNQKAACIVCPWHGRYKHINGYQKKKNSLNEET